MPLYFGAAKPFRICHPRRSAFAEQRKTHLAHLNLSRSRLHLVTFGRLFVDHRPGRRLVGFVCAAIDPHCTIVIKQAIAKDAVSESVADGLCKSVNHPNPNQFQLPSCEVGASVSTHMEVRDEAGMPNTSR